MDNNRAVHFDRHTNLLQLEEHMYPLVDVEHPNTFRNLYPYTEIPKIAFNDRIVPHHMPDDIWITDTTFRDGQQSRAPYSTEQIVTIYDHLHRLGGHKGLIRQSEFFLYSKKDRDAVYKCMERGYKFPEVTSWIRASKEDFQLVKDLGMKETGILVSCSDYHIFYNCQRMSGDWNQSEMPSGGYHQGGHIRLCDSVLSGIKEYDGLLQYPDQGALL